MTMYPWRLRRDAIKKSVTDNVMETSVMMSALTFLLACAVDYNPFCHFGSILDFVLLYFQNGIEMNSICSNEYQFQIPNCPS